MQAWTDQSGQATVEWSGVVLLLALALGGLLATAPAVDGRSLGGALTHRITCAITRDCHDGDAALGKAYGSGVAELVRAHAPNLVYEPGERQIPVDWRGCRRPQCANAPDERSLDVHRTDRGERATAFTRVVRRAGRTNIQYWLNCNGRDGPYRRTHRSLRFAGIPGACECQRWRSVMSRYAPLGCSSGCSRWQEGGRTAT